MFIKKVTESDCDSLANIFNEAHIPFENIMSQEEIDAIGGDLKKTKEDCIFMLEGRETYCAFDNNEIVGYISFRIKNEYVVWISELYVNPSIQGKGVGRMLIDFVKDFTKKSNCKLIALETHRLADWAIGFYEKLGFEIINEKIDEDPYNHILDKPPVPNRPILALKM